jgi:hypothetical protein
MFYYASDREQAAAAGFDDAYIYGELSLPPTQRSIGGHRLLPDRGQQAFIEWERSPMRIVY